MPDEPSLDDVLRGSLAHHAEDLVEPSADIATVWSRVDRRRARRRSTAVIGSVVAVAAGAAGIMLVANPIGSSVPLDGSDGSAALAWACTGPLGSDGTYDYFEACDQRPRPVAPPTTPASIVGSTIDGSVIASAPVLSAPPTTAFSPIVSQQQQYVVVEGDSYFSITDRFGLEPDALHNYNGWPEGVEHMLVIGEQVLIPPSDVATVTTVEYAEQQHEVAPGDSLAAIADRYGIDLNTLVNYNAWPEGLDHVIFPGDVVLIPPYGTVTLAPSTTASVPDASAQVFVVTNPPCGDALDDVTLPCGTAPVGSALTSNVVVTGPSVAGDYRCTDLLGMDGTYQYYASCELVAVPTSSVAGTALPVSTTTTTMTIATSTPASTVPGEVRYTIGAGDNPGKVAEMFGITVDELVELNPDVSQTFLVGQVLRLPPGASVVDLQEQRYVAVAGDSLTSIAERFGIGVDTLVAYNGWAEGIAHPLVVDETVKIPPGAIVLGLG